MGGAAIKNKKIATARMNNPNTNPAARRDQLKIEESSSRQDFGGLPVAAALSA